MRYSDYYNDIRTALDESPAQGIETLSRTLSRLLRDLTSEVITEFANDAARMYYLCRKCGYKPHKLSTLWNHRHRWQTEEGCHDLMLMDALALAGAVQAFTRQQIPSGLARMLPSEWKGEERVTVESGLSQRMRLSVCRWNDDSIWGLDTESGDERELRVVIPEEFAGITSQLYEHAQINVLDFSIDEGIITPRYIILDPDYLLDITSVTSCMKQYGDTPLNHLLNMFMPAPRGSAIQMGNLANQFLDDALQGQDDFQVSMQKSLHDYPLQYLTLPIGTDFFQEARRQHENIQYTVKSVLPEHGIDTTEDIVTVEPAFICESLGLQGRMDMLATEKNRILELKSGKSVEYPSLTYQPEHAMQMALYKEILWFNCRKQRSVIDTYLLYSKYPTLYDVRLGQKQVSEVLNLRNGIVHLMKILRSDRAREFVESLSEGDFNINRMKGKLYEVYLSPRINSFLSTIKNAGEREKLYFWRMLKFVAREQQQAKTGDDRPDSNHGFAQVWQASIGDKLNNGDILTGLKLELMDRLPVTRIRAWFADYGENFTPNFREGDSVMLYESNDNAKGATSGQIFRCSIRSIKPNFMLLELPFAQREERVFNTKNAVYAMEHAYMDSTFTTSYRGLYAFLQAPIELRQLLMGRRRPTADDFRLVVGPPGTGKTNRTLRLMVEEWMAHHVDSGQHLLVMAYTHRAVDEICGMLKSAGCRFLRIAHACSVAPSHREELMESVIRTCRTRMELSQCLLSYPIIVTTVSSAGSQHEIFDLWQFDRAIIDEASQILEPQLLPLWCKLHHITLIGDHKQLPAVVMQNSRESQVLDAELMEMCLTDCRNSLFERLHALAQLHSEENLIDTLVHQGRMHEEIGSFASQQYYGGRLQVVPLPHQRGELPWKRVNERDALEVFCAQTRMGMIDVKPEILTGTNKVNTAEAKAVAQLVMTLEALYRRNAMEWSLGEGIGIIVPFRAQISAVRNAVCAVLGDNADNIMIDTVERYQGSQRDVIIYTTVIRNRYQVGLLSEPTPEGVDRKLNVAVTRARLQFFLVGNMELLSTARSYRDLIEYSTTFNTP